MTPRPRHGGHGPGGRHGRRRMRLAAEESGTLAALRPGQRAVIECIECPHARAQALRFGMGEGAAVACITALPAGPVVLKSGRQEIAVGRGLARRIRVRGEVA